MRRAEHVLVVGGGIAGLGTARALHQHGSEGDVVERADRWEHPGAGMYLPANSLRALDRLGLRVPMLERAREVVRQRLSRRPRASAFRRRPADLWGQTDPCLALGRGDFARGVA